MTDARTIRVLLVNDHLTQRTLRSALQAYPNIEVVGEARDGDEALASVAKLQPTVVVMDIHMSRMEGASATRLIKLHFPDTAVIGISLEQKDYQLHAMQKAGAFEVLVKGSPVAELYSAIQRAATFVQPGVDSEER
jgi:DNA-binding NarL/FixJ family response regulator